MKRIGILSDTHSYWDEKYLHYFEPCDEIWHAGDIGSVEVAERLAAFRPFRAVCGNCDGGDLRLMYHELNRFKCEDVDISVAILATTTSQFVALSLPIRRSCLWQDTRTSSR